MDPNTDTSTVAAALTVKPAVNKQVLIAAGATLVVTGVVVAAIKFKKARDAKNAELAETEEN